MPVTEYAAVSWERMSNAIEKVRLRLLRAAAALARARIPYAVAGGNAVAAWVSRVDEAAVRNTQGKVGLVNQDWLLKVPETLRARLQELLDNPEG